MTVLSKPLPALYTVYVLRSTVRHASLYIGSTPNPPRRLKQHNGQTPGGAARTARPSLRPWEMVALVSGFPSSIAALKFEWALDNPHLSLHIPSESRISVATQRKKNGHPRRPGRSLSSIISNLHLLLRVPSFGRWPLRLHFLAPDVHKAWEKWCATAAEPMRTDLPVLTDFRGQEAVSVAGKETADAKKKKKSVTVVEKSPVRARAGSTITISDSDEQDSETEGAEEIIGKPKYGVHALPATYDHLRAYIAKGDDVFRFEREGSCVVCREKLESGKGLHALCSNHGCEGVGHLSCWSDHLLAEERRNRPADAQADEEPILPVQGTCPKCHGPVQWSEMMTELTLRVRGPKEVQRLLRKKPRATAAT